MYIHTGMHIYTYILPDSMPSWEKTGFSKRTLQLVSNVSPHHIPLVIYLYFSLKNQPPADPTRQVDRIIWSQVRKMRIREYFLSNKSWRYWELVPHCQGNAIFSLPLPRTRRSSYFFVNHPPLALPTSWVGRSEWCLCYSQLTIMVIRRGPYNGRQW